MEGSTAVIILIMCALIVIGLLVGFVDMCCMKPLEEVEIPCVITHMDIDDGSNFISVVSTDGSFSGTVQVSSEIYAQHSVGDSCTVVRNGFSYPISADEFVYRIQEEN